jgi:hypothetical protein
MNDNIKVLSFEEVLERINCKNPYDYWHWFTVKHVLERLGLRVCEIKEYDGNKECADCHYRDSSQAQCYNGHIQRLASNCKDKVVL